MQDGAVLTSLRSEHRYAIDDAQLAGVSVAVPTADGEAKHFEGSLADLSRRGVRLVLNVKFLTGQAVTLRLALPEIDVDWTREATVVWIEPRDAESWWIGCSLNESLDADVIDRMAVAQIVNRRRDNRYAVAQAAQMRWELSDEVCDVRVVNFSKGGFCALGPVGASVPSERVMLLIEENDRPIKVPARVMWNRATPDGHAFGCSFTTRDGFVRLREAVEPNGSPRWHKGLRGFTGQARFTRWVILAVAVLCTTEFLQLVGGQPQLWQSVRNHFVAQVVEPIRVRWKEGWTETPPADDAAPAD